MTGLLELRGVVEAAPDAVAEVLLGVRPGGRSPLARPRPSSILELWLARNGAQSP